ncbi:MAG: hypothetical protein COC19_06195 [SAR86 cluster bacterium]|uniref:Uncharacterized protein n=1 Tax=SAR86 cluster bacterium TaxID=2030880 RepID=A0A2A4MJA7_9GAMM|nr:MAG: hypothetical protein COC19_06195 [SAR86 cluster bacterium]
MIIKIANFAARLSVVSLGPYQCRISLLLICLNTSWFFAATSYAQSEDQIEGESQTKTLLPSLELLEFLGQWETDAGEWVNPNDLNDDAFVASLNTAIAESSINTNSAVIELVNTELIQSEAVSPNTKSNNFTAKKNAKPTIIPQQIFQL